MHRAVYNANAIVGLLEIDNSAQIRLLAFDVLEIVTHLTLGRRYVKSSLDGL